MHHSGDELAADGAGRVLRRVDVDVVGVRAGLNRIDELLRSGRAALGLVGAAERNDDRARLPGRSLVDVRRGRLVDPGDAGERPADRALGRVQGEVYDPVADGRAFGNLDLADELGAELGVNRGSRSLGDGVHNDRTR